ncbi:MAG: HD family phosphohydrolase [Marinifilaceae bacterium]
MTYLFPKTGVFQYEYRKGNSWNYEQLVAPFDFPIYKNDTELANSRQRILEQQGLIFDYDKGVGNSNIKHLQSELNKLNNSLNAADKQAIIRKLTDIYDRGIYILPEKYREQPVVSIRIIKNNISEEYLISALYTPKKAYQELSGQVQRLPIPEGIKNSIIQMDLAQCINPNLEYNEEKSKLALDNALKDMALTQGMVKQGDLIIEPGELITQEKFDVLNSLKKSYSEHFYLDTTGIGRMAGQFIITLIGILIFTLFLTRNKRLAYHSFREFIFLYTLFFATVAMILVCSTNNVPIFLVPFLFFIIIVNVLIDMRTAAYMLIGTTLIASFAVAESFQFAIMQLTAGVVSIFSLSQLQRRSQLFVSILYIFVGYAVSFLAFELIYNESFQASAWFTLVWLLVNCLLLMLAYLAIYLFERLFGYTSEITLMELSNPNHPALRSLTQKAPGTFQHSLMVANLAEEAIYRIGGDPLLARTGALYHDIGKMNNAIYFIENQSGGLNPHSALDFDESAQIIISHVRDGVDLAKKYNLPTSIMDFIKTHHGRSKVKYFYNSYVNKHPDLPVDEMVFTYEGPDPISRECAVVMMADAVEATSRSLKEKSEENIEKLVNDIIDSQVQDGRFEKSQITFSDIAIAKRVFIDMLVKIYHSRIAYPKLNKDNENEKK